jgi:hypothetical protein
MEKRTTASARVEVVIELPASGSWGTDCSIDQIYRQAGSETLNKLRQVIRAEFGPTAKVLGDPKVQAVVVNHP